MAKKFTKPDDTITTATLIRCSVVNPVLMNKKKLESLQAVHKQWTDDIITQLDVLFDHPDKPQTPKTWVYNLFNTKSARANQLLATKTLEIIHSVDKKIEKAQWKVDRDIPLKQYERECLNKRTKPVITTVNLELDYRFTDIQLSNQKTIGIDYWIRVYAPNGELDVKVPCKFTKAQKRLMDRGYTIKVDNCRFNHNMTFTVYFEKETPKEYKKPKVKAIKAKHSDPRILGVDAGIRDCVMTSEGVGESTHAMGHKINAILSKIATQKRGSKNNKQTRIELEQQIRYSIKHDIPWHRIDVLVMEKLWDMKRNNKTVNQDWRVALILKCLKEAGEEQKVFVHEVNPAYTSQECHRCHHIDEGNRVKGSKNFCCLNCGLTMDADHNAAIVIRERGRAQIVPCPPVSANLTGGKMFSTSRNDCNMNCSCYKSRYSR